MSCPPDADCCLSLLLLSCSEIAASQRLILPPRVSTSTLRATKPQCHSGVRPVPTLDAPISPLLSPVSRPRSLAVGEGSEDSPKQEDEKNESRSSKADRKQRNRATPASPRSGLQREANPTPR